jgi:hypothetical protein
MNLKKSLGLIGGVVFIVAVAACRQPSAPTPIAIPTPNLTLTALFEPTETIPPSVTPPAIQTATPMDASEASPTPVPTQTAAPTDLLTKVAPTDGPADSQTATHTPVVIPEARTGPIVEAQFLDTPPFVDGDLDEWELDSNQMVAVVFGADKHNGSEDLSGTFMVGWDNNQLYIAAQVIDDIHVQNAVGRELFKGDSLEVLLDKNLRDDFFSTGLGLDDYQLGISPGAMIGDSPSAYLWFPEGNEGPRVLINIAAVATKTGYQIEIAIPWSVFGLLPSEGEQYGFGFSLSDNDEIGTSIQQTMVSNISTRILGNPTTWGNLVLSKP